MYEGAHTQASGDYKRIHWKPPGNKTGAAKRRNVRVSKASKFTAIYLLYSVLVERMALTLEGKKEHTLGHLENPKEVMGSLQETRPDKEKSMSADPKPPGRLLFLSLRLLLWLNVCL